MRKLRFLYSFLVVAVCFSCKPLVPSWNEGSSGIQLGYIADFDISGRGFEHEELIGDAAFVAFFDKKTLDEAKNNNVELGKGSNRFEYSPEPRELVLKVYPKGLPFEDVELVCSEPSILKVVGIEDEVIRVRTLGLGDVELTLNVTVGGQKETLVYPVRVVTSVDLDFYITPYWMRSLTFNLIRYKVSGLPAQEKDLVTMVTDSVSVVGYCEYYDFEKSRNVFFRRDTVRLASKTRVDRFRWNCRKLVREISGAMRDIESRSVTGTAYKVNPLTGQNELQAHQYPFEVEQVVLDFNVVSDNPFVEFYLHTRCDKTFDTFDEDDDALEDDGGEEGQELSKSEKAYFKVLLNDFRSEKERQAIIDDFNTKLRNTGYNASLSDAEKDRRLAEINQHYKDGEKK